MAGVKIEVQVDDRAVRAALERLVRAGANPAPVLREIGEYLDLAHRERWDRQESPDGQPWEPLADATLRGKMLKGVRRGRGQSRKSLTRRDGSTKTGAIRCAIALRAWPTSGAGY